MGGGELERQAEEARLREIQRQATGLPQTEEEWIEALVEVDRKNSAGAEAIYADLVLMDEDVDTPQQASLVADKFLLELRSIRREESIPCAR